jgi:hypothetical protein
MSPIQNFFLTILKLLTQMIQRLQEISELESEKPKSYGFHIMFTSAVTSYTHACACRCVSVADSLKDAVLLHISASSEGQQWGDETGAMKKEQPAKLHNKLCPCFVGLSLEIISIHT